MGWPSLSNNLNTLAVSWNNAVIEFSNIQTSINNADKHWQAGQDHEAIQDLLQAAQDTKDTLDYMLCYIWPFVPKTCLCKILYQLYDSIGGEPPPEYELTAKKICEAWAVNDFEDRALTIAFIDRMRQIIWNEPFYVAWAARPET